MPRNNTQKHLKRSKIGGGGRFLQSIDRFCRWFLQLFQVMQHYSKQSDETILNPLKLNKYELFRYHIWKADGSELYPKQIDTRSVNTCFQRKNNHSSGYVGKGDKGDNPTRL